MTKMMMMMMMMMLLSSTTTAAAAYGECKNKNRSSNNTGQQISKTFLYL